MSNKKFTPDHEWLSIEGEDVVVGITDFAQDQLGNIVFIELPEIGDEISVGEEVAVIESVKAAGGIKSPISGIVSAVNEEIVDDPELVNRDPENQGWFYKVKYEGEIDNPELIAHEAYQALLT